MALSPASRKEPWYCCPAMVLKVCGKIREMKSAVSSISALSWL